MYVHIYAHLFDVGPVARWTRHRPTGPRAAGSNTPFPTRGGGKFVHSCACTRGTIETKATACHSDQNRIQDSSARQPTLRIYRRSLPLNHHHGPIVENVVNWKPRNSLQQRSCASTVVFDYEVSAIIVNSLFLLPCCSCIHKKQYQKRTMHMKAPRLASTNLPAEQFTAL